MENLPYMGGAAVRTNVYYGVSLILLTISASLPSPHPPLPPFMLCVMWCSPPTSRRRRSPSPGIMRWRRLPARPPTFCSTATYLPKKVRHSTSALALLQVTAIHSHCRRRDAHRPQRRRHEPAAGKRHACICRSTPSLLPLRPFFTLVRLLFLLSRYTALPGGVSKICGKHRRCTSPLALLVALGHTLSMASTTNVSCLKTTMLR